jgi:hypothetical protein
VTAGSWARDTATLIAVQSMVASGRPSQTKRVNKAKDANFQPIFTSINSTLFQYTNHNLRSQFFLSPTVLIANQNNARCALSLSAPSTPRPTHPRAPRDSPPQHLHDRARRNAESKLLQELRSLFPYTREAMPRYPRARMEAVK